MYVPLLFSLPSPTHDLRNEWLSLSLKRRTDGQNISSDRFAPSFATLLQQLRQIWQLADADGDSKLSLAEFCVGMHLIVCVSKKGLPCPATRPPSLFADSGGTLGGVANSAQVLGGSPAKPVPQSPIVRSALAMQPPSSPPSAMLPLGAAPSTSEDAFNAFRSVNMALDKYACFFVSSVCMVFAYGTEWGGIFFWCFGLGGYSARG